MEKVLEPLWPEYKITSSGFELQEDLGQKAVVENQNRLPKNVNSNTIPYEIYFKDVSDNMTFEERYKTITRNCLEFTKSKYAKMGIEIVDSYDSFFYLVKLPEGWSIKATEHPMWNELFDNNGQKRATFFYKASFHDTNAFINFEPRFRLIVGHSADPLEDEQIWRASDYQGVIKDCGKIIYSTRCIPPTGDYFQDSELKDLLYSELETFMQEHGWPDYENCEAYWES